MLKRTSLALIAILMLVAMPMALAQDATPTTDPAAQPTVDPAAQPTTDPAAVQEPAEEQPMTTAGLGDIVNDRDAYYGQTVTVEGALSEFVNVRSFILDDQAALANNVVLVINNSPASFDINLDRDDWVRVTGVVYPAYNEGGFNQLDFSAYESAENMEMTTDETAATPEGEVSDPAATPEMVEGDLVATPEGDENLLNPDGTMVQRAMVQEYSQVNLRNMIFPEDLGDYIIIEITSVDGLNIVPRE